MWSSPEDTYFSLSPPIQVWFRWARWEKGHDDRWWPPEKLLVKESALVYWTQFWIWILALAVSLSQWQSPNVLSQFPPLSGGNSNVSLRQSCNYLSGKMAQAGRNQVHSVNPSPTSSLLLGKGQSHNSSSRGYYELSSVWSAPELLSKRQHFPKFVLEGNIFVNHIPH